MQITSIDQFLDYYSKLRGRTKKVVACIPPEKLEWTYSPGKFTLGDLVRHLAAIERYMYGETVQNKPSLYTGCGIEFADGFEAVVAYFDRLHEESCAIFQGLSDEALQEKCVTPGGTPITTWKWLRALCEHEIHHRGQIYTYLGVLEVATPPLYGLTSEQVAERAGRP